MTKKQLLINELNHLLLVLPMIEAQRKIISDVIKWLEDYCLCD